MYTGTIPYNKCECGNCGSQYATVLNNEIDLSKEKCPNCGEKELKLIGPLSFSEMNGLFYGGG